MFVFSRVNQIGLLNIIGNEMESVNENVIQKNEEYLNENVPISNNDDIIVITDDDDDDNDNYPANNDINETKSTDENVVDYRIDEKVIVISDDEDGVRKCLEKNINTTHFDNNMITSDDVPTKDNYNEDNDYENGS